MAATAAAGAAVVDFACVTSSHGEDAKGKEIQGSS